MRTHRILGVNLAGTNAAEAAETILSSREAWRGEYICLTNVHTAVMAYDDPAYLAVQNGSCLALPDGGPLASLMRRRGDKDAQRVSGADIMGALFARGEGSHFFYGSTPETLEKLDEALRRDYPGIDIRGMVSPPFRLLTDEEDAAYVEQINASQADFVWVGLGAPKQENWMAAHRGRVSAVMLGTGAAFDFYAGTLARAPGWMQAHSLEWLYRLLREPRRLFGRYFKTNTRFLWLLARGKA